MGFFKRLFSSDYRAAIAAEAAGDLELAAEHYALAGQTEATVRVHLARAERADSRNAEISALRDALHWAPETGQMRERAAAGLGKALLARARAEGVATEKDRARVREAAIYLAEGSLYREAGEALASIGDDVGAAEAFRKGGLVDLMEGALNRESDRGESARIERDSFSDYEAQMRSGERDAAVSSLRRCIEAAAKKSEYRRLLDELESRLITAGRVELKARKGGRVVICARPRLSLGRDALADLSLRSTGVSRRHAEIELGEGGTAVILRDAGSKNGTLIGGLPVAGDIELKGDGSFSLGEHCTLEFEVADSGILTLRGTGLDADATLIAATEGATIELSSLGVSSGIFFRDGRPVLMQHGDGIVLNGERIARGNVQLIHDDVVSLAGIEVEVL